MIRFSAALVVVAVGVLIGGIVTSTMMLVYAAIALSAAALIVLAIGVALKRDELFGDGEPPFQLGDAAGQSGRPGQAYAGQSAAGQGWSRPGAQGASSAFQGVTGWPAPPGSGRGDVTETRTDIPPAAAAPSGGASSGGASRAGVPAMDATRTDMPAIDATRTDIPPISPVLADRPANATPAGSAPTGSAGPEAPKAEAPKADAPQADAPRAAASPAVTETRSDMTAISADAPAGNDTRSAPRGDETRLDLPATPGDPVPSAGSPSPGSPPSPGSASPGGPVAPASSAGPASGAVAAKPDSGTRQVAVVPGVPRYHALNCILVRFMDEGDLEKMSQDEANAAGYTPCAACQADTGSFKVAE